VGYKECNSHINGVACMPCIAQRVNLRQMRALVVCPCMLHVMVQCK